MLLNTNKIVMIILSLVIGHKALTAKEADEKDEQSHQLDKEKPYCSGSRFSLQYGFVPGFGYCFGNEHIQVSPNLYFGLFAYMTDMTATYTLSPKKPSSWYIGARSGFVGLLTSRFEYKLALIGYHFGGFSIELGAGLVKSRNQELNEGFPKSSKTEWLDPNSHPMFDLRLNFD